MAITKCLKDQKKGKRARGTAEGGLEPQHVHLQGNQFHAIQAVVQGRTSNARGNQIPKCKNNA
jgi:hypothetical protein